VQGLYLEGAHWDKERRCLARSHPRVLVEEMPMLLIIPIQDHRLRLQVSNIVMPLIVMHTANAVRKVTSVHFRQLI
jgi:hypothetical protein